MLVSDCIVIGALILTLLYFKNYLRAVLLGLRIPGPKALPILGNVHIVNKPKALEHIGTNGTQLYGRLACIWISVIPIFLVMFPQDIKVILGSSRHTDKNIFYGFMHNFLGQGLITNSGEAWRTSRRLIQPHFHINILREFVPIFVANAQHLTCNLRPYVAQKTEGSAVKISEFINQCVLENLYGAVLGIQTTVEMESSPFRKGQMLIPERVSKPWLMFNFIFNHSSKAKQDQQQKGNLKQFVRKVLAEKRLEQQQMLNTNKVHSLLEILMEINQEHPEFQEEDIINEACTLMLAGQDSVGSAVAFTLFYLAKHQEIQEKCFKELEENTSGTIGIGFDKLQGLQYLEQCIKEAMRLCPSIPLLSRKLTEDAKIGKHTIPVGSNVFISPFLTHRIPEFFPDPLKYDPERFSTANQAKIDNFLYFPFSSGPRNCIGYKFAMLEMKAVISEILQNFHLKLPPGCSELDLLYRVTLRCRGGVMLQLENRQKIET